ncbi:MAG: hypothetical protein R3F34_12265 [Planctomycetota bacterium]
MRRRQAFTPKWIPIHTVATTATATSAGTTRSRAARVSTIRRTIQNRRERTTIAATIFFVVVSRSS